MKSVASHASGSSGRTAGRHSSQGRASAAGSTVARSTDTTLTPVTTNDVCGRTTWK